MQKLAFAASAAFLLGSLSLATGAMAAPAHTPTGTSMSSTQSMGAPPPATRSNDADDTNANSNGRYSTDRDTGLDRSQDRASAEGLKHRHAMRKNDRDSEDAKADDRTTTHDADTTGKDADTRK